MSIIRINEYQAKEGKGDVLRETLNSFDPIFKSIDGYHSHQVLQNVDDPTRIVVIEVWDSIHAHQVSLKKIPIHAYEKTMQLLTGTPKGAYYTP